MLSSRFAGIPIFSSTIDGRGLPQLLIRGERAPSAVLAQVAGFKSSNRNRWPDCVGILTVTMTSARIAYLYDLMDAAYDAVAIHDHAKALGHMPIIDRNFRAPA
jgi:hypothetical protein